MWLFKGRRLTNFILVNEQLRRSSCLRKQNRMKRSLLITMLVCLLLLINCINLISRQSTAATPVPPAKEKSCLLAGPCEKAASAADVYLPTVHLPGNY